MESKNGAVDISCFFLVEESGDSEADYVVDIAGDAGGDDSDDAESCCHNTMEIQMVDDFDHEDVVVCDDHCQEFSGCDEPSWRSAKVWRMDSTEEGEEEVVFGISRRRREVMDGMEDKHFWETCIAAGYP